MLLLSIKPIKKIIFFIVCIWNITAPKRMKNKFFDVFRFTSVTSGWSKTDHCNHSSERVIRIRFASVFSFYVATSSGYNVPFLHPFNGPVKTVRLFIRKSYEGKNTDTERMHCNHIVIPIILTDQFLYVASLVQFFFSININSYYITAHLLIESNRIHSFNLQPISNFLITNC